MHNNANMQIQCLKSPLIINTTDRNRQMHAKFMPFFKFRRLLPEKWPFFISRIHVSHWKKYHPFHENGWMGVRFGREQRKLGAAPCIHTVSKVFAIVAILGSGGFILCQIVICHGNFCSQFLNLDCPAYMNAVIYKVCNIQTI